LAVAKNFLFVAIYFPAGGSIFISVTLNFLEAYFILGFASFKFPCATFFFFFVKLNFLETDFKTNFAFTNFRDTEKNK